MFYLRVDSFVAYCTAVTFAHWNVLFLDQIEARGLKKIVLETRHPLPSLSLRSGSATDCNILH